MDATARLRELIDQMRTIAMVAGQCSVEGSRGTLSAMAAAEAERASRWANELESLLSPLRSTPQPDSQFVAAAKESLAESRAGLPHLGEIRRHADRLRRLEAAFDAGEPTPSDLPVSLSRAAAFLDAFVRWVETHDALRSTPQEGTTDDLTRIGELAVQPPPQHAATDREDL